MRFYAPLVSTLSEVFGQPNANFHDRGNWRAAAAALEFTVTARHRGSEYEQEYEKTEFDVEIQSKRLKRCIVRHRSRAPPTHKGHRRPDREQADCGKRCNLRPKKCVVRIVEPSLGRKSSS